ncbi:hypothetical protein AMELA_G00055470, partial [Ameiurus melas]
NGSRPKRIRAQAPTRTRTAPAETARSTEGRLKNPEASSGIPPRHAPTSVTASARPRRPTHTPPRNYTLPKPRIKPEPLLHSRLRVSVHRPFPATLHSF